MGDWISLFDQKLGCPIRSGRHQPQKGQSHVASRARSDAEPIRGSFFSVPSRLASSSDPFLRPLSPRFLASSTPPLPILPSPLFCPCQRIREFERKMFSRTAQPARVRRPIPIPVLLVGAFPWLTEFRLCFAVPPWLPPSVAPFLREVRSSTLRERARQFQLVQCMANTGFFIRD